MTRPRDSVPSTIAPASVIPQQLQAPLLWTGALLCAIGLASTGIRDNWHAGRLLELLVLAGVSLGLAWPLQRFARLRAASALACVWIAALALFADPLPVLAVLAVAAAATAAGGWIAGSGAPLALACACGLALLAGVLGWLVPLPVHHRWSYVALCVVLVGIGHRDLSTRMQALRAQWSAALDPHPRAATLGVLALGLASTGCWLPTMQFDDLAYHLGLPWQLATTGRYALDPTHQVWALAPWATDVQHALPQVMAGAEARGPLNALWIAITAAGLWHLGAALDLRIAARWAAIALYAGLPLTAGLAAGMQTETAATGVLVWLAWLVMRGRQGPAPTRALWTGAVLTGGLVGLKLMGVVYAGVLLTCAALARRPWPSPARLLAAGMLVLGVAGSSYAYAAMVAGNPFLPLLNAVFESPFFAPTNFEDARWRAGVSPWLPWRLTFDTHAYAETLPGSAGFVLIGLLGAWVLALLNRRTALLALAATAMLVLVLLPLQYLRYAFPALVVVLPALAAASVDASARSWPALLGGVAVLGFAFQANGNWMQRNGALKQTVLAVGRDAPLLRQYAPERLLAEPLRAAGARAVLYLDDKAPAYAELGTAGRGTAWYAPTLHRAVQGADADPSGQRWRAVFVQFAIGDVVVRGSRLSPAQAQALRSVGAIRRAARGDAQWWAFPEGAAR